MSTVNFTSMDEGETFQKKSTSGKRLVLWAVIMTVCTFALLIAIIVVSTKTVTMAPNGGTKNDIRWCTVNSDEQTKCSQMMTAFQTAGLIPKIQCIAKPSTEECVAALEDGTVDAMTLDGGHIYNGRSKLKPVMAEDYGNGDATYWAVAVVKKSDTTTYLTKDGLSGKKSCHTGLGKSAGWNMPMGTLIKQGIIKGCNATSGALNLFGNMCAPGGALGSRLCAGCNKTCKRDCDGEIYCGYTGAFRCLVEGGDVAFVKHTTVYSNTDGNNQDDWAKTLSSSDYQLLCQDGSRNSISAYEICNLGRVPSHAVVVSVNALTSTATNVVELLHVAQLRFGPHSNGTFQLFNGKKPDLLFKSSTKFLLPLKTDCTTATYLGEAYLSNLLLLECATVPTLDKQATCLLPQYTTPVLSSFRWCVTSANEMKKCENVSAQAAILGNPLEVSCVLGADVTTCAQMISQRSADGMSMDGGHIYDAGRKYYLKPVAAEYYGSTGSEAAASYYAVAVAKTSDNTRLTQDGLRGKMTCHTGYKRTSGWNVPVGFFIDQGILSVSSTTCDIPDSLANFLQSSCVPGIKASGASRATVGKLCQLCNGTGQAKCAPNDPFSGYTGAFNCMATGAGNVAFVKHATALDTTLVPQPSQYHLLCRNGTTAPVTAFETCNIARVPSHAFMISHTQSALYREKVWSLLKELQDANSYDLFSSSEFGGSNLLFKDSTLCLWKVDSTCSYADFLGSDYIETVRGTECDTSGRPITTKQCRFVRSCI